MHTCSHAGIYKHIHTYYTYIHTHTYIQSIRQAMRQANIGQSYTHTYTEQVRQTGTCIRAVSQSYRQEQAERYPNAKRGNDDKEGEIHTGIHTHINMVRQPYIQAGIHTYQPTNPTYIHRDI